RVISSPSISTTGVFTLIFAILQHPWGEGVLPASKEERALIQPARDVAGRVVSAAGRVVRRCNRLRARLDRPDVILR
ncbi:hypothetical protein, partial [uncultured Sphingomonas sp.]|uniref:hypothetical protein n=1 Tax=uncultured Sphingomonas sp. TaxID=158754 RepID=UPI0035CB03C2